MMKLWGDEVMAFLKEFLCVWNCVCVCAHSEVFVKRGLHDCTLAYMLEIVFVSFKKRGRMKAMIFFHYIIISNRRLYKNGKVKNKRSIFIGLCVWLGETKKHSFSCPPQILLFLKHATTLQHYRLDFVTIEPHEVKRFKKM